MASGLLEGFFDGGDEGKDGVDARDLEEVEQVGRSSGDDEAVAGALAVHVVVDNFAHAGGVDVGDFTEINDGERGFFFAEFVLQLEVVAENHASFEFEDARAGLAGG